MCLQLLYNLQLMNGQQVCAKVYLVHASGLSPVGEDQANEVADCSTPLQRGRQASPQWKQVLRGNFLTCMSIMHFFSCS